MNLRVEHGGLYRDLLETSMSKVISPSTKGFSWEGEETPAVYRSLYQMALINIYHVLNLRVEHGGLYRDLHE